MSDLIIPIDDGNCASAAAPGENPCLLDFSAEWCGPCKQMKPIIEAIARDYQGKLRVGMVDIEASPNTAARFGVMSVPTFVILARDGAEAARFNGAVPRRMLDEAIGKVVG
jgi:thioredoxin 1